MKIISITGIDRSGKTSVIKEFTELTNGNHYIFPRDISTIYFFNKLENREPNKKYDKHYHRAVSKIRGIVNLSVLLYCDPEILDMRFKDTNEHNLIGNLSVKEHMYQIEKYFDECDWHNIIKIDTGKHTVKETARIILENLK